MPTQDVTELMAEDDTLLLGVPEERESARVEDDKGVLEAHRRGVDERRLGDIEIVALGGVEGREDLVVEGIEPGPLSWSDSQALAVKRCFMPRSPRKPMTFRTTSSKPGSARSVCSAARSAGCSQATGAIWVNVTRSAMLASIGQE
jgi:hypothetical protein